MKTRLILHGGFEKGSDQSDIDFFGEILKNTSEEIKILLVYFAENPEKIPLRIEQDKQHLEEVSESKSVYFKIATEEEFEKEIEWANVVYLHGGSSARLAQTLKKFSNLNEIFLGKIIAGDSAGAKAIGEFSYSKNSNEAYEGIGLLPMKVVAHYKDGDPDPTDGMRTDLETVFLKEYETKVFEI